MKIILAIILGGSFGFVLDRVGASNPQKIINMLRLKDFHLMKVLLFAIGFSSLLLFILLAFGLVDLTHISIKSAYIGVLIGGLIFGIGFAIGGYCPGTSIVGASAGRKDALFFIIGSLFGALFFTIIYNLIEGTFLFDKISGGKTTIATTNLDKYPAILDNIPAVVVAGLIAVVFMIIAFVLPQKKES